jgi:hypothetical protein
MHPISINLDGGPSILKVHSYVYKLFESFTGGS